MSGVNVEVESIKKVLRETNEIQNYANEAYREVTNFLDQEQQKMNSLLSRLKAKEQRCLQELDTLKRQKSNDQKEEKENSRVVRPIDELIELKQKELFDYQDKVREARQLKAGFESEKNDFLSAFDKLASKNASGSDGETEKFLKKTIDILEDYLSISYCNHLQSFNEEVSYLRQARRNDSSGDADSQPQLVRSQNE